MTLNGCDLELGSPQMQLPLSPSMLKWEIMVTE